MGHGRPRPPCRLVWECAVVEHVLVAPDKFKGSLTAAEVAAAVAGALAVPAVELPVADGGDGTVDAAVACGFTRVTRTVTGPTGEPVEASYARRGDTAVVELAEASGLRRLPGGPEPLTATSHGTGELVADAVRQGATRVVLGLGGSACTDGGAGLVRALGARFLDAAGADLPPGGAALRDLERIDISGLLDLSAVEFVVASDVDNPLLGPHGAAAVYGPQKGADPGPGPRARSRAVPPGRHRHPHPRPGRRGRARRPAAPHGRRRSRPAPARRAASASPRWPSCTPTSSPASNTSSTCSASTTSSGAPGW